MNRHVTHGAGLVSSIIRRRQCSRCLEWVDPSAMHVCPPPYYTPERITEVWEQFAIAVRQILDDIRKGDQK